MTRFLEASNSAASETVASVQSGVLCAESLEFMFVELGKKVPVDGAKGKLPDICVGMAVPELGCNVQRRRDLAVSGVEVAQLATANRRPVEMLPSLRYQPQSHKHAEKRNYEVREFILRVVSLEGQFMRRQERKGRGFDERRVPGFCRGCRGRL